MVESVAIYMYRKCLTTVGKCEADKSFTDYSQNIQSLSSNNHKIEKAV